MRLVNKSKTATVLECTPEELAMIGNALNESLEVIEEWEFAARMGATRAEVEELLATLSRLQPPE